MTVESVANQPIVISTRAGGVLTLTLNRPERFNPLSSDMIAAVLVELAAIAADPDVRVVVLAAEGRGFCAGHDLKEMRAHAGDKEWTRRLFDDCSRMMVALTELPQPVIARVHGIATAAGCQLVSMCDLAVAADTARFALPGVNIGRKRAMEMLLTGELFDAATALDWGLVNQVVAADALDQAVAKFTDIIVARSPATVRIGKRAFYAQVDRPLASAYDLASDVMTCNLLLDDAAEGIDAFLQKRAAQWVGR